MHRVLIRKVQRRNPFVVQHVPWIARLYVSPFERWKSLGQQALFGAPNFLLFFLYRKFSPFKPEGRFSFKVGAQTKNVAFDATNTQFSAIYSRAFRNGYEPQTSALVDSLVTRNGVFYDVGSNWGWFSLMLASRSDFQGVIHAFEPLLSSYKDLTRTIESAGLSATVHAHNLALSDHIGTVSMHLPDRFQSGRAEIREDSSAGGVRCAPLDSLNLEAPSLIKIDVEGAELKVLAGARKILASARPMIVLENSRSYEDIARTLDPLLLLRDAGYNFYHVGWLRKHRDVSHFVGDDGDPQPQANEILSLTSFSVEERFLHSDAMNVFACHRDKIGELEEVFEPWQSHDLRKPQ